MIRMKPKDLVELFDQLTETADKEAEAAMLELQAQRSRLTSDIDAANQLHAEQLRRIEKAKSVADAGAVIENVIKALRGLTSEQDILEQILSQAQAGSLGASDPLIVIEKRVQGVRRAIRFLGDVLGEDA
jgi:hypothetical protein